MDKPLIENLSGWRKRQVQSEIRLKTEVKVKTDVEFYNELRNDVIEEVAKEIESIKFGDTSASFAVYIRGMKK